MAEPEPACLLVERGLRDDLLQHLTVEAKGARLVLRQRAAELASDLLQPIGVSLTELVDRNLGSADRGQRRLSKSAENIGDAPTPKLTINTPITTVMMVLPSQFDEALRNPRSMGPICSLEVNGSRLVALYGKKRRHRIDDAS